ncbi:MAG: fumarylacetoacetate hydrolase family protein [Saprospiraceae bacterium]|jgi:2-keto-4-pentenoate hydratase/2-oxohepta-3-ene-1,7-dioic acid hydratase in catechol pathway
MKLVRFGPAGLEKPGLLEDGIRYGLNGLISDFDERFFSQDGGEELAQLFNTRREKMPLVSETERWGAPLARPSKLICIGLNYAAHARESGMEIPKEPVVFFKATSAICGPYDQLVLPRGSAKTDWEVELAVVIGQRAQYVSREKAMDHVFGYLLHNDYSERAFQLERGGQWVKGKSADTFAPLGPFLVTKDEIKDVHRLNLWTKVNGREVQNSFTSDLVFDVPEIVSYLSQFMTLLPGDIISTGTPFGVGMGNTPPTYLQPGDIVETGIEGLGIGRQEVVGYAE